MKIKTNKVILKLTKNNVPTKECITEIKVFLRQNNIKVIDIIREANIEDLKNQFRRWLTGITNYTNTPLFIGELYRLGIIDNKIIVYYAKDHKLITLELDIEFFMYRVG